MRTILKKAGFVSSLFLLALPWCVGQGLEKLGADINTSKYDEISPVLSKDGHTLYFTRLGSPDFDKNMILDGRNVYESAPAEYPQLLRDVYFQLSGKFLPDPTRSDFNQDIWIAESENQFFDKVFHPVYPLNNAFPNSICAATSQPNQYIVINQFPKDGGMRKGFSFVWQRLDGSWTPPEPMPIKNYYTDGPVVNLALSSDEDVIILSLARSDGKGMSDLYISFREVDGSWTEPENLGKEINTEFNETTPSLSEDMTTLFFASNRPGSEGVDVYFSRREVTGWKNWSTPRRLAPPINSSANDSQPFFNAATGYLYFTSDRDGSNDIFRLRLQEAEGQKEILVKGRIINSATGEPIGAKVLTGLETGGYQRTYYLSSDGHFRIRVPKGELLRLVAEKEGFIGQAQPLHFDKDVYYFKDYEVDLFLDPLVVDAKISLRPIFFERSKAIILSNSYEELDNLAVLLLERPGISVRIEGHTDNIGEYKSLMDLSEQRAMAVKDFLVRKGVHPTRVETVGYGPSRPLSDNKDEDQRSINRRVEVRITKIDEPK
ncbi:MAG: OmpA family protein [Saprospirales bacterium]|nr:OmpA family protein [Saprospirales bacterium]